ncbi:MAG: magnesium/cobalt transporter CorA [Candidatus Omnitrophica bacterium]|nr:magnesium/cobalt transporter CorA [Candidatus Omnitrophota bacterium]
MDKDIERRWTCYVQIDDHEKAVQISRDEVQEHLEKGRRLWVDILAPTAEDTGWLEDVFDFHTLALSDVLNNDVQPKQETYDEVLFTVFGAVNFNPGEYAFDTINLNLFLTDRYIVTTHSLPLRTVHSVRRKIKNEAGMLSQGADHVYYLLLDNLVDRYVTLIDEMENDIEDLEEAIFAGEEIDIQETLFALKRKTTHAKRSLRPKKEALKVLVYRELPQISDETRTNLRDILDHVSASISNIESHRELLNSLMDSYMSRISNKMNQVMEMLSIIATIMLPLSFLTGLFGMNFNNIPGLHTEYGFWLLVLFMFLMVAGMIGLFKKKGIL